MDGYLDVDCIDYYNQHIETCTGEVTIEYAGETGRPRCETHWERYLSDSNS